MYAPPSSPQSVGGVVDDALRLFRASFGRCWLLAIIPGLAIAVYELAFPVVTLPRGAALTPLSAYAAIVRSPRVIGLDLVSLLLMLVFQGAVLVREIAIVRGDESCTFGRALEKSVGRLPGTILGTIIFVVAIGAGFVALLIPGFWLWGRLQLWTAALFVEDATAIEALGSSWRLTKGHWWRAATIFTVAVIILIVLSIVFSLVGGFAALLLQVGISGRTAVLQLFSLGSAAIAYPLDAAIWLAMYHDFKLRREGGDLAARAGALSGAG